MAENPPRDLIRKLQLRGGKPIRLSYDEADLTLALLAAGAASVARERAREARDERIQTSALERASRRGSDAPPRRRKAFYA